jgi:hypothetical protein
MDRDFYPGKGVPASGSSTGGGDFRGCFDLPDLLVFSRRCCLVAFRTFFDCLVFLRFLTAICHSFVDGEFTKRA